MAIKFTIGIKNVENISKIKASGISMLYCGYLDNIAAKKWPESFCIINRRGEAASIYGKKNFKQFALKAEQEDVSIYVTFNGIYTIEQYEWLLKAIKFVSSFSAVKGIIVSDIGLLLRLKQIDYNKDIVISTGGSNFNSATVSFYKQFGIKRIVLDRQLKTDEIISILENNKDIDFELFVSFGNCLFIDSYCSLLHTLETQEKNKNKFYNVTKTLTMCGSIYGAQLCNSYKITNNSHKKYSIKHRNNFKGLVTGCNLCNIFKLKKYSNRLVYKIVSRGNIFIDEYNLIIPYLQKMVNIKNNEEKQILFKQIFGYDCNKTGCYANEKII